jgi:5-methylthioribose kinase
MDTPNYARYLQSVYQNTIWEVARIPHGSINATLHAVKTAGQAGPQSLILKRASPFFEDEGQLQPFSLNRQVRISRYKEAAPMLIHAAASSEDRSYCNESLGREGAIL